MGNQCCNEVNVPEHEVIINDPKPSPRMQQSKKKDYSNFASYGKIKEQNNQIIANKTLKVEKFNSDIAIANMRREQKIKEQTATRKDLSFQIRKIQNQIQSLTKLRDTEQKAIKNLKQM